MGKGRKGRGRICPNANTANEIEDFKKRQRKRKDDTQADPPAGCRPALQYEWP